MKNIIWCLADLIINFIRYVAMKQEINRIGTLVVLPLLLATTALYFIGEADAYQRGGVLEETNDVFYYRGDLTSPHDEKAYGGEVVGKYFVMVNVDEVKIIAEFDNQPSEGKVFEVSLVDIKTGERLSVGHLENGELDSDEIVESWIYDLIIINEASSDSNQQASVGGAELTQPPKHTSSNGSF